MSKSIPITEDPNYARALKLNKEMNNKYSVDYIVKFIREWDKWTRIIRGKK